MLCPSFVTVLRLFLVLVSGVKYSLASCLKYEAFCDRCPFLFMIVMYSVLSSVAFVFVCCVDKFFNVFVGRGFFSLV